MESPKTQPGHWARTVISKKENMVRSPTCKFNPLARKSLEQRCLNSQLKPPKCYIKITGSRYNGTFLLNIDDGLDDAIYHTMRDIEVALEEQADPMGKPSVSPKNCLSSVFRCFGTSDLQARAVCNKRKSPKSVNKPAECSLTATVNKSDLGPLMSAVQSKSFDPSPSPENSSESVIRDVVDVFRTTLDQFRKENLSSFEAPPSKLLADPNLLQQSPPKNISETETVGRAKQSNEELKRVSFIKFSQEEVLVIQPPKPASNDTKELEVGIEVKPKTTALNVGQSIKLAKDKVLIGVQDGRGVLQINDGIPKRSLQMVIEEGINGKPSMKLSLKEENPDQKEHHLTPEQNHTSGIKFQVNQKGSPKSYINSKFDGNDSVSKITNNNKNTVTNAILPNSVESQKSVESQVAWAHLEDITIQPSEKRTFKSESTQYHDPSVQPSNASHCACCSVGAKPRTTTANVANEFSEMYQVTVIDSPCFNKDSEKPRPRDSRINRMPYFVHTLYEPRSLNNSSAYFTSDRPSTHCSIGKGLIPKKLETSKRQIKKPKSFSFSSDYSSSSKCTKIFRDIGEIGVKGSSPLGKKDASMTTLFAEDFEKILQNMCGSSYLCHHPKPRDTKLLTGMKYHERVPKAQKHSSGNMSFDQWTQTDSFNQKVWAGLDPTTESHIQKDKSTKIRESGDGSHSRILRKKDKRTKSNTSQRIDESSLSTSGLEDGLSSDSSDSNKHKLVFSMFAAEENPLAETSLMGGNWINGKAKSVVGQKIFAAIEDHTNHTLLDAVENTDSFVYPACKDASGVLIQGGNNVSVVNMALYDGPTGPPLTDITEEDVTEFKIMPERASMTRCDVMKPLEVEEEWDHNSTLQAVISKRSSCPIRVKSKSCQNLSLAPNGSRRMENVEHGKLGEKLQTKRLRYPQLTAADSNHTSTLDVCGILNFHEGETKTNDRSLKFEKLNSGLGQALPSAIRSLLLPRQQSLVFNNCEQIPTYCCDRLGTTSAINYLDLETFTPNENDWCTSNEAFESLAVHTSLLKRTFFAMKAVRTVVTRKFSKIFRKLSFTHPDKKMKNLAMNNSVVYVAIPLRKKSENLQLYPRVKQ